MDKLKRHAQLVGCVAKLLDPVLEVDQAAGHGTGTSPERSHRSQADRERIHEPSYRGPDIGKAARQPGTAAEYLAETFASRREPRQPASHVADWPRQGRQHA